MQHWWEEQQKENANSWSSFVPVVFSLKRIPSYQYYSLPPYYDRPSFTFPELPSLVALLWEELNRFCCRDSWKGVSLGLDICWGDAVGVRNRLGSAHVVDWREFALSTVSRR